jgi:hypothetical protein
MKAESIRRRTPLAIGSKEDVALFENFVAQKAAAKAQ